MQGKKLSTSPNDRSYTVNNCFYGVDHSEITLMCGNTGATKKKNLSDPSVILLVNRDFYNGL